MVVNPHKKAGIFPLTVSYFKGQVVPLSSLLPSDLPSDVWGTFIRQTRATQPFGHFCHLLHPLDPCSGLLGALIWAEFGRVQCGVHCAFQTTRCVLLCWLCAVRALPRKSGLSHCGLAPLSQPFPQRNPLPLADEGSATPHSSSSPSRTSLLVQ